MVPALLSPTAYAGAACRPEEVLQFLHALRALLRRHADRLTALVSLPLALHPRAAGLTRWLEILSDGVLELVPLPPGSALSAVAQQQQPQQQGPPPSSGADKAGGGEDKDNSGKSSKSNSKSKSKSKSKSNDDDHKIQGMLRVHALPVFDEKGGGSHEAHAARCEDQSFGLSRSRGLVIRPFSLPPVLGDDEHAREGERKADRKKTASMEF